MSPHLSIALTETAQSIDNILYSKSPNLYMTYVQSTIPRLEPRSHHHDVSFHVTN